MIGKLFVSIVSTSLAVATWMTFFYAKSEAQMGEVQRIFYFHVPSAIATYLALLFVFFSSIRFLLFKQNAILLKASIEISALFATMTLMTGMIWAKAAWNTWFTWEPQLVTFLCLWGLSIGGLLVELGEFKEQTNILKAICGILACASVPLVWISVKLLPTYLQLHPKVIENDGLKDVTYVHTFLVCLGAINLLALYLIYLRTRLLKLEE